MSARIGAVKQAGRASCSVLLSPSRLCTVTIGREAAILTHLLGFFSPPKKACCKAFPAEWTAALESPKTLPHDYIRLADQIQARSCLKKILRLTTDREPRENSDMRLQPFTSLRDFDNQRIPFSGHSFSRRDRAGALQITAAIKKRAEKHVVCSKTLVAKPGQEKRVQKKCQDILDFSLGKAANKSNGIMEFVCSQDIYDSNVFHFWERYDGNVSLGRHNTTPEYQKFMETVQDYLEEPIGLALYAYQNGQISNVCVQGGPKGEGGLDDATGASKSAGGGASMKQTSQTVNLGKISRGDEGDGFGMGFRFPWQKKKEEKDNNEA